MVRRYTGGIVGKILSYAVMNCPICKDTYHTKGALSTHLNKEHIKSDIEKFLEENE